MLQLLVPAGREHRASDQKDQGRVGASLEMPVVVTEAFCQSFSHRLVQSRRAPVVTPEILGTTFPPFVVSYQEQSGIVFQT